jgi:large subunit ribosomal protein L6
VLTFIKYINKGTKKHLFLKGLGLKVNGLRTRSDVSTLKFKLGYSHEIPVTYSSLSHNILLRKTHVFIEGSNPVTVGNFAKRISMLRKPDSYKGRGVWLHGRRYKLKVVKKKK